MKEFIEKKKKEFEKIRSDYETWAYINTDNVIWGFIEQSLKEAYEKGIKEAIEICEDYKTYDLIHIKRKLRQKLED